MATKIPLLFAALVLAPSLALAQPAGAPAPAPAPSAGGEPTTAAGWYQAGSDHYNLGEFDAAIESFKKGFSLETVQSKKAAYLYNIAQSYRVKKDCANGVFFYKRFLEFKDQDTAKPLAADQRAKVNAWIAELEACAATQTAVATTLPTTIAPNPNDPAPPATTAPPTTVAETQEPGEGPDVYDGGLATSSTAGPTVVSLRLVGGATVVSAGDLDVPVRATGALIGGYPFAVGPQLTLEAGAAFTFAAVPAGNMETGTSSTASFYGLMANAGLTYQMSAKLGLRLDVGVGALLLAGAARSDFTGGADTTGALAMPHVRAGLSADFAFTKHVIGTLAPFAFSYSPAKAGLRDDIKSITAIDVMVGVGYRI